MTIVSLADTERPKTCDTGNIYVSIEQGKDNVIVGLPIVFVSVTTAMISTLLKLILLLLQLVKRLVHTCDVSDAIVIAVVSEPRQVSFPGGFHGCIKIRGR